MIRVKIVSCVVLWFYDQQATRRFEAVTEENAMRIVVVMLVCIIVVARVERFKLQRDARSVTASKRRVACWS